MLPGPRLERGQMMAKKPERKKLGRGLSALLGDLPESDPAGPAPSPGTAGPGDAPGPAGQSLDTVPIDLISPNPDQPRRRFDEDDLEELAQSIRARGVIQPVVLRPDPANPGRYQIVAGERRWRAAQRAQLHDLPAVIRQLDDRDVLELAIIENIQRADLNAVEEAEGYRNLIDRFDYTQEELARTLGKSRPHVANTLRLLALPQGVLSMLRNGKFTAGHARAMLGAPSPSDLCVEVLNKGLSVRQTEERARQLANGDLPSFLRPVKTPREKDADTRQLEGDLSATIGMKVAIDHAPGGGGELRIRYRDLDDLDRLCQQLSGG